jgi:phosphoribosylamine--glycine ligase
LKQENNKSLINHAEMNILVVGKGGREHAIAVKMKKSPLVSRVYVAPGSDGIQTSPFITSVNIEEHEHAKLINFVQQKHIRLVVIGPETALMNGLTDELQTVGIPVFAPNKAAAIIEGSKEFAKKLMKKYHIPTADFAVFSDYAAAWSYVQQKGTPIVIKYDGLAAGKGVVVAQTLDEAQNALKNMLIDRKFGKDQVVIEEFLEGIEFSLMALVHHETVIPLQIAQDHKRAYDNNKGPNTGGMGAYSPVPTVSEQTIQQAIETIMKPTAIAMKKEGRPFTGVLYGGLIATSTGPKVIEFNARFGDPETEVILPKMKSDLAALMLHLLNNGEEIPVEWFDDVFLGVVMASKGYPESSTKNVLIKGLEQIDSQIFHMGTTWKNGEWYTDGGRILFVLGQGKTVEDARKAAYSQVNKIKSEALFFRKDIGKAL